jgi:hypothetical protein
MNNPEPKTLLEALARKFDLRFVEHEKRYLGVYRGVCIDAWHHAGSLHLYFYSPTVQLTADDILDKAAGFPSLAKSPIPVEWVQFRMLSGSELDRKGCLMELSPERMGLLSEAEFLSIPELMIGDLRAHGASTEPPVCSLCGDPAGTCAVYATNGYQFGSHYQFACQSCFRKLRQFTPGGVVNHDIPLQWRHAVRALALWSVGFTVLWGLLQSTANGLPVPFLLAAPFAGSLVFCRSVGRAAQGMSLPLRLLTVVCILSCILVGNLWGFHAAMLREVDLSWAQTARLYFTKVIPDPQGNEWIYLLGGLAGSWVGFNVLKRQNTVRYQ